MDKVLLIEDDRQIRELLPRYFFREGFEVEACGTGYEGLDAAYLNNPTIVLLDVNLPDIDGWSVLRRLRQDKQGGPYVIMLTGRGDISDKLMGLELGADDYIVKPFEPMEVVARVKAILRRNRRGAQSGDELEFEGLSIDAAARTACREGKPIQLTAKEFDLLLMLVRNAGKVIERSKLYEQVWGDEIIDDDHTLEVHINKVRTKIEGTDGRKYIATVRGVGYKFEVWEDEAK